MTARVVDVAGRIVARVADEQLPPGEHQLVWNGRRGDGTIAPAGIYLLEVKSGTRAVTGRIVRL